MRMALARGTTVTRLTRFRAVARTRTALVQLVLRAVASALVLCSHTLAATATRGDVTRRPRTAKLKP